MKTRLDPVLGIPIRYDDRLRIISEARGLWPWKRIVIGPQFFRLEPRCQAAILLHEAGHAKLWHLEKRVAYALANFWRPAAIGRLCREQEFEADRFAAGCGYGRDLAIVFALVLNAGGTFHPSPAERIERLVGVLRERTT